jgi:hypothetical protein
MSVTSFRCNYLIKRLRRKGSWMLFTRRMHEWSQRHAETFQSFRVILDPEYQGFEGRMVSEEGLRAPVGCCGSLSSAAPSFGFTHSGAVSFSFSRRGSSRHWCGLDLSGKRKGSTVTASLRYQLCRCSVKSCGCGATALRSQRMPQKAPGPRQRLAAPF